MARKRQAPVSEEDRAVVGGLLRDLRRAAGFRSVESAASTRGCPASRQTIYAYERGGLVPPLAGFLELVEFYALGGLAAAAEPEELLRARAVAAVVRALSLPAYHVTRAIDLVARLQAAPRPRGRRA